MAVEQRSIHALSLVAVITVIIAAVTFAGRVSAAADAGEFLISFGKRAAKAVNDENLTRAEQEARFRELFNEAVDVPAIGRFVLGHHWRKATEQEREDFLRTFEDFALQRFLPMFTRQIDEYQGKRFDIVDIRPADSGKGWVFVRTLVIREQAAPASITWRIRAQDGQFKIFDVSIEGISMIFTLRHEYSSVIRRTGGVGGLVDLMREKLRSGAFAPKAKEDDQ